MRLSLNPVGARRQDNEGFHETELEIEDKDRKEEPGGYSPALMSLPNHSRPSERTKVNMNKPKLLIREVAMMLQPSALNCSQVETSSVGATLPLKHMPVDRDLTLYEKYVGGEQYQCLYHKYSRERLDKLGSNEMRRLFNRSQFASYFVNLDFLTESSNSLLRNLQDRSLQKLLQSQVSLQFDSRFECGNLFAVFKSRVEPRVFDLVLQNDINTKGYNNWFYFSLRTKKAEVLTFRIVNLVKQHHLCMRGMQPAVFSYQSQQRDGAGWKRQGKPLSYARTEVLREGLFDSKQYYFCLTFEHEFKYENDVTFFALNVPYSYSRMLGMLGDIEVEASKQKELYFKREIMTRSISANQCPLVTLTMKRPREDGKKDRKKVIGIIARQHPSETVGSFVMEGCLRYLVGGSPQATFLLNKYIFKIVPMVNIDGVMYGNSRCDISGSDINRQWQQPNRNLNPIIAACRDTFTRLAVEGYDIDYFLDLHGHSKKYQSLNLRINSFIYGCGDIRPEQVENRELAFILSKVQSKFNYDECIFQLSRSKKSTARANILKLMKSSKSLTLETSFFGYSVQGGSKHFSTADLIKLGESLLYGVYLSNNRQNVIEKSLNFQTLEKEIRKHRQEQHASNSDEESIISSESEPYGDQLDYQTKQHVILSKSAIALLQIDPESLDPASRIQRESPEPVRFRKSSKEIEEIIDKPISDEKHRNGIRIRLQKETMKKVPVRQPKPDIRQRFRDEFRLRENQLTSREFSRQRHTSHKSKVVFTIEMPNVRDLKPLDTARPSIYQSTMLPDRQPFWTHFKKQMQSVISQRLQSKQLTEKSHPTMTKYFSVQRMSRPFILERRRPPPYHPAKPATDILQLHRQPYDG